MLTLLSELRFLTNKEDELNIKDIDFGAFSISNKKRLNDKSTLIDYAKKKYVEKRGNTEKKVKTSMKHLEEAIKNDRVVYCGWTNESSFHLMLSNGLFIYIDINISTGDIKCLNFDKFLVGKIISENICDVIITPQHVLISYNENQITFIHLQKPSKSKKISTADPKIFNVIVGAQTKKTNRNLVINITNSLVLIWTHNSQSEFYPWRPLAINEQERANLHIYKLSQIKFELLCYHWTENEVVGFEFSKFNENELYSVEQKISRKGEVTANFTVYTYSNSKSRLDKTSVTSIPLQTEVSSAFAFSPDHEKLVIGCIDGSIVLYDRGRGITYLVKASFIPNSISWHPDSALIVIANERAQLQCFDISLSCIKHQLVSEEVTPSNSTILDVSSFFIKQPNLLKFCWSKKPDINNHLNSFAQTDIILLMMFEGGTFGTLKYIGGMGLKNDVHTSGFTADVIIQLYLSLDQVDKAINVLLSLNWDTYGAMSLLSLHKIATHIFKLPATVERTNQLQRALGSFHTPAKKLCFETENEFGDNVDDITRRFFHYLIRYKLFEKAFCLAIDINDADLFMILHKCSKAFGENEIAIESFNKAEEIYAKEENDSHHSSCSITSCSICSSSSYDSEEGEEDESDEFEKNSEYKTSLSGTLKKSTSADDILDHNYPPLPVFPKLKMNDERGLRKITPPLPQADDDRNVSDSEFYENSLKNSRASNELTLQNLSKFNKVSQNELKRERSLMGNDFTDTVIDNNAVLENIKLDQIGIPVSYLSAPYNKPNQGPTTTIHTYPLISGTIPSIGMSMPFATMPSTSKALKRDIPPSSILTNPNSAKEGGEKNKVKFSDTITVAVVPEISRNEKIINYNERMKRKTNFTSIHYDPRRELAESLPLCHPNEDYLKDFLPAHDSKKDPRNKNDSEKKPSIKVVNFGLL